MDYFRLLHLNINHSCHLFLSDRHSYHQTKYHYWFLLTLSCKLASKAQLRYNRNMANLNRLNSLTPSSNVFSVVDNMSLWYCYVDLFGCIGYNIRYQNQIILVCLKLSYPLASYGNQLLSHCLMGCQKLADTNDVNIFLQCYIFLLDQHLEFSLGDLWSHQRRNLGVRIGLIIFSCII